MGGWMDRDAKGARPSVNERFAKDAERLTKYKFYSLNDDRLQRKHRRITISVVVVVRTVV